MQHCHSRRLGERPIEEKKEVIKETKTYEEIKLDFDTPIVKEVEEEYDEEKQRQQGNPRNG